MKKRALCFILAVLMLASVSSCAESSVQNEETSDTAAELSSALQTAESTAESELSEYELLLADVPKKDFEGYEFNILNNESNFAYTIMDAEEINGEGINDAVYNRNAAVEDTLNITVNENMVTYSEVTSEMKTQISAGDSTYSCFWNESYLIAPFASEGSLLNLNKMPAFDFDKPWWNDRVMSDVEIGGKRFFLIGDLHLMFKESYQMIGFNKNIIDANALTDPYELVREGKWTMDTYRQYMETSMLDKNGDGRWGEGDIYGCSATIYSAITFLIGGDVTMCTKDENGIPAITAFDDHFIASYEKMVETLFSDKNYMLLSENFHTAFKEGYALFYSEPIGSLKKLRDMDAEFGIVPVPKLDENQGDYVSNISLYAAFCGIPITADAERTSIVLENLCAQSFGDLRQAYEDDTLNFKYIRDRESSEMLNLIFSTGRYSLLDALGITQLSSVIATNAETGNTSISSALKSVDKVMNKSLERTVKKIMETDT